MVSSDIARHRKLQLTRFTLNRKSDKNAPIDISKIADEIIRCETANRNPRFTIETKPKTCTPLQSMAPPANIVESTQIPVGESKRSPVDDMVAEVNTCLIKEAIHKFKTMHKAKCRAKMTSLLEECARLMRENTDLRVQIQSPSPSPLPLAPVQETSQPEAIAKDASPTADDEKQMIQKFKQFEQFKDIFLSSK